MKTFAFALSASIQPKLFSRYDELCRLIGKTVTTPQGPGTLVQVFHDRVCVIVEDPKAPKKYGGKVMQYYDPGRIIIIEKNL